MSTTDIDDIRAGDCSVGGSLQYGISYQIAPAPVSAYVAGYVPAG